MLRRLLLLCCAAFMAAADDLQGFVGGKRTLVLLDNAALGDSHSDFFRILKDQGHQLTYEQLSSSNVVLKQHGEFLFDNLVIMSTTDQGFGQLSTSDFMDFVDNGGNMFIAAEGPVSSDVRQLAAAVGIKIVPSGSVVVDHFAADEQLDTSLDHTVFKASNYASSKAVLGAYAAGDNPAPVLYSGVAHTVEPGNILSVKVLSGNPTTFATPSRKNAQVADGNIGHAVMLVSGMQARNNARVTFAGSVAMFSNRFFAAKVSHTNPDGTTSVVDSGNALFARELVQWSFNQRGVLRFRDVLHHKSDGSQPDVMLHEKARPDLPTSLFPDPEIARNSLVYRIKEDVIYSFVLEQWEGDHWAPYIADDVQLEFVMLDPYVRKTMTAHPDGRYTVEFKTPDTYGIFKFHVMYRRSGLSTITINTQVAVRPFKHNEYERFIFSAYPYYTSAFTVMAAFFVFSVAFFFSSDK